MFYSGLNTKFSKRTVKQDRGYRGLADEKKKKKKTHNQLSDSGTKKFHLVSKIVKEKSTSSN